jgi:hypothetical protein
MRVRMQTSTLGTGKGGSCGFQRADMMFSLPAAGPLPVQDSSARWESHVYTIGREIQMRCDLVVVRPCLGHAICRRGAAVEGGT